MSQQLTQALASIERPGVFAARREVSPAALRLSVTGVGPIAFPISSAQARELCGVARPARHGFKDETRLDRRVRNTWEIAKSRIKIDQRHWNKTLIAELERFRDALGLAAGSKLRAELHNMLVYAPGQFFVPHQDSEKADDMIGTLVVTLPSEVHGGAMIIEHCDERVMFRGSRSRLALIAFYADCHHEVRPVSRGYRIVLTYNLLASVAAPLSPSDGAQLETLTRHARAFFRTAPKPRWPRDAPREPPDRLVYLLDHEYTQRSLGWGRLKGADGARVAALREVARRLDCEIALAQADVREIWSCEDEYAYGPYGRRGSWRHDEEDEDDEGDDAMPDVIDLEDRTVELRHFIDEKGNAELVSSFVDDKELCYTKPSLEMHPFKSEHEGYMGNYGNTVERWYHRAAVVLWPRERTFVLRARASARWAMDEVARALAHRQVDAARNMVEQLAPFWAHTAGAEADAALLAKTLRVALELEHPGLGAVLARPFRLDRLTPEVAPVLGELAERYGLSWCRDLLEQWSSDRRYDGSERRDAWLSALPRFVRALCASGASTASVLARALVSEQCRWLTERYRNSANALPTHSLDLLTHLAAPILGVLESACVCEDNALQTEMLKELTSGAYPARALVKLLERAQRTFDAAELSRLGLAVLHAHCQRELTALLERPARGQEDWSITPPGACSCALCNELARFLVDAGHVRLEWPLAKPKRRHVHGILDGYDLPVRHTTIRSGSPHTLVLVKTKALFEREAKERAEQQRALRWLEEHAHAFRAAW